MAVDKMIDFWLYHRTKIYDLMHKPARDEAKLSVSIGIFVA